MLHNRIYYKTWFFSANRHRANTLLVWQHLPWREICDLYPGIKPMFGGGEGIVFHPVLFFSYVPSSYCESQYDLSQRVRGKWADHCQLLYPEGEWGSTRMSGDLSSYMKVAVNVAHYCFERLHLKKNNLSYFLGCFFLNTTSTTLVILTKPGKNTALMESKSYYLSGLK